MPNANNHVKITVPQAVGTILDRLENSGHEAYVVGGCVRDSVMGLVPHDWDICTSATPDQVEEAFKDVSVIDVGRKFGTVAVFSDGIYYEITTFRADGRYLNNRKPENVSFVSSLADDLARRDFTVNAMAYNDRTGLIDLFDGIGDIERKLIRCVGDPEERFNEDALRILRALRFSSRLGFEIENETSIAIHDCSELLSNVSAERLQKELNGIILGKHCLPNLLEYSDVFSVIIPELEQCEGFDQKNRYHKYNVYDHMMYSVHYCDTDDLYVRLALFLHDIGKPLCYSEDERGGHFYGHADVCASIAKTVLSRLRYDAKTVELVSTLIKYHSDDIRPTKKSVRKWLNLLGEDNFERLICLRAADHRAHATEYQDAMLEELREVCIVRDEILNEESCFTLRDLAINGSDLIELGVPEGKDVGRLLNKALNAVIEEKVQNEHGAIIAYLLLN